MLHSDQGEMVKRKANISIDEWLEGGVSTPETSQAIAAAAKEESAQTHGLAAEVAPNQHRPNR